ncbi:helicase associated domain protein, partial [Ostertagia ostertagi]
LSVDPRTFPFIERPEEEKLNEALNILKFQGVLYPDRDNQLTALGSTIAKLPVDVAIAKMLVLGCVVDHVEVILTVAAGLSVQSPFTNRSYRELEVVQRREGLTNSMGDPFTLIEIFRSVSLRVTFTYVGFGPLAICYCGDQILYREWMLQKCTVGKARRWALENGIDEHRMYEISKLRFQYRQILEDAGLIERPDAHELGEDDSRQRRIDQGDKKKLLDMKREARNQEKTRKVLRADKHFDSILNDVEEEDLGSLSQCIVAIEAWQWETLEPHADSEGRSVRHKILFYGLLLETTKPYICNVLPLPALNLLLFAKKVICDDWKSVLVDEFVEMTFSRESHCKEILQITIQIRMELNRGKCLQRKLYGQDFSARVLTDLINRLAYQLCEGDIEISDRELEMEDPVIDQSVKVETVEDEHGAESAEGTKTTRSSAMDLLSVSDEAVKKERKPTYYELLQQRMREREATVGDEQAQEKTSIGLISWE